MPIASLPRRLGAKLLALALGAGLAFTATGAAAGPKIVVDVGTGKVIAQQDAFVKWYPASLAKLMTIYVAFGALKSGKVGLDSTVTMSKRASAQPASKMYFQPGAQLTLESALKMLMVNSANDIAVAIAERLGGSVEQFVDVMNAQARRIGMTSTRYTNPHGLPGQGQYTTARDQAVLALALKREFPQYRHFFSLEGIDTGSKRYPNHNMLIGRFQGADGMKTGFICAAGFNLVGSATRGNRAMIAVVLGAESLGARTDEAAELLQQGFSARPNAGVALSRFSSGDSGPVMDVSEQICNAEARKQRRQGRDENGRLVLRSQHVRALERDPVYSFAGLLAAARSAPQPLRDQAVIGDGAGNTAVKAGTLPARVPIPRQRPAL